MDQPQPGTDERSQPNAEEARPGDRPTVIADVATGRARPAAIDPASPEGAEFEEAEKGALDYILTPEKGPPWEVEVQLTTPAGLKPLLFIIEPQDARKIVEIEERNTSGSGPLRRLDEVANNAELVASACIAIEDPLTGRKIDPGDADWRGPIPSKAAAMERRFARQGGLISGIAGQVRSISGYNSEHVGKARQRAVSEQLVSAVGGS